MQIMRAVTGSKILVLQLLLHFCFSSLHVSQFRACNFFILCLCSNTSKERTFLLHCLTQKAKKNRSGFVHHDDIAALLQSTSLKHPCDVVVIL